MADLPYATCPYNKNHRILVLRMPQHVIKCQRSYMGPPLKICKYNATHRVLDMEKHLSECREFKNFMDVEYYCRSFECRKQKTSYDE
ncbi:gametocyte-specific factor 1 [Drosophila tropicalis]|uniref:gametocyte-specific factor 1 n=1 Tax=Drosophila tropicalis TaxID=46794 RepID=UPI0035AC2842